MKFSLQSFTRRLVRAPESQSVSALAADLAAAHELARLAIAQRNDANAALIEARRALHDAELRVAAAGSALVRVFGHEMYTNPKDEGHKVQDLRGVDLASLQGEIGYLLPLIKPGQTVLDIGANVGLLTLLFARCVGPTGRVIGFEPGPVSFGLLSANVALNRYRHVELHQAAVADFDGTIDLFVCATGESDNRISGFENAGPEAGERIPARACTVDWIVSGPVHFIKMDVQGAEMLALRGMLRTLENNRDVQIALEYAPSGPNADALLDLAASLGFSYLHVPEAGAPHAASREWLQQNIPTQTTLVWKR